MAPNRSLLAIAAMVLASWTLPAAALDRAGAIAAARHQVARKCTEITPCTFTAKAEGGKWYVRVQFTRRKSLQEEPYTYPGGHAMFIVNHNGKVVGRIEGN